MKHTPGPWIVDIEKHGGNWDYKIRTVKPHNSVSGFGKHIATVNGIFQAMGQDNARLIAAAPSMKDALWAIANMQVTKHTNKAEVLALCMSIAKIEMEKITAHDEG